MIKRILIVGLGSIGRRHLKLARQLLPTSDIRILRHKHSTEIPNLSNGCFFDINKAIDFDPQIAVIANPSPFHLSIAQILAEKGVHLLIEKPLSNSTNGVKSLLNACKKRDVILLLGYNLRFLLSLQYFHNSLSTKIIGKILSVRCEVGQYLPSWRSGTKYQDSVSAQRRLGGGSLLELSHEIDYIRWIFGEIEWVNATLSQQSGLEIDVEDTAHLTLGFMRNADGYQLIGVVNLDFIRQDKTRYCIAIGEKGSLRWDGLSGKVELYKIEENEWSLIFDKVSEPSESYLSEWENFINCVTYKKKPLINGEDGLKVLEIIDAARKSSLLEKKVYLRTKKKFAEQNI